MVCLILGKLIILLTQSFSRMRDTRRRRAILAYPTKSLELNVFIFGFMLTIHTSEELLQELEDVIKSQYKITVKYDVESYLGVKFEFRPNGDVKLTLFEEYKEELKNHRVREPLSPQRLPASHSTSAEPMEPAAYLHLEGALIYLTESRRDIHTAVSFTATHSVTPTRGDFEELIHCLKYLEATQEEGLVLKAGKPNRELILRCYVDASYLSHSDSKSHQSFGEIGTFYSKSSNQQLVSTSSTQSEIRALHLLLWISFSLWSYYARSLPDRLNCQSLSSKIMER